MTNVQGWRAVVGVLAPSTNTVVETDLARMAVPGVTTHIGRIHIRDIAAADDAGFERLLEQIRAEIDAATERVLTCEPDALVMGMSAETFWGGLEGAREFAAHMREISAFDVTTGAQACRRALELYGARRIGVVTPYQAVGDGQVERFFTESGFEVTRIIGLRCESATAIAHVTEEQLREALVALHADGPDAIVQVGTNLSMVSLADAAQRWLGIPVIAINAATWWAALRDLGIEDRIPGAGDLLARH